MTQSKKMCWVLSCALALVFSVSAAKAATPEAIAQSLKRGCDYLYTEQKNGHWELSDARTGPGANAKEGQDTQAAQWTGRTALAVYALLAAGEDPKDARIKKAVDFLVKNETKGVYALGMRCQVWMLYPPTADTRAALLKDATLLRTTMKIEGNGRGMYDYVPTPGGPKSYSHSRSQFAVLGMWAAAQSGLEIPDTYWKTVDEAWRRNQAADGGWSYKHPADDQHQSTAGMTAVGVASLFLTQEYLRESEGINCRPGTGGEAVEKGIQWIAKNTHRFATDERIDREYPYTTLYAIERAGMASGMAYFGTVNWFNKGADWLLKEQRPSGEWPGFQLTNTCFGVLFLAKGRAPVVISKLRYTDSSGKDAKWNGRPRDAANVVRWIGKTLERDLAWQSIHLDVAIEDLLESPILYIAGNEPVDLSPAHKSKLKLFIESGGMVLANADCGSAAFAASIKKLANELFPDYEFGEMPEKDILYTNYYPRAKWKSKPSVQRLSNGARPLIVLIPQADIAKSWQVQETRTKVEAFELAADLLLYSVDNKKLRYRGTRYYLPDGPKPAAAIDVVRLKYNAAWDPEPGGWRRLNSVLAQRQSVGVNTTVAELGKSQLGSAKIAHLTGTVAFKLTDAQRSELKQFVQQGGTLVIDACAGRSDFATAAEAELAEIFPGEKLQPLAPDHALYTAGGKADNIAYRSFAVKALGESKAPRLQALTLSGRAAVIYSREDLSEGLVGQEIDGILGYTPETATNLMIRILNHARTAH